MTTKKFAIFSTVTLLMNCVVLIHRHSSGFEKAQG